MVGSWSYGGGRHSCGHGLARSSLAGDTFIPWAEGTNLLPVDHRPRQVGLVAHPDGVCNLYSLLQKAAETGLPQTQDLLRYDIRNPSGEFAERYWRTFVTPMLDEGRVLFLLVRSHDLTATISLSDRSEASRHSDADSRSAR